VIAFIAGCSSSAHRSRTVLSVGLATPLLDIPPQRREIERPRHPKCPRERPTTLSEVKTLQVEVHVRSSARQPAGVIGNACALGHNHP
jgi:hypothetical protein